MLLRSEGIHRQSDNFPLFDSESITKAEVIASFVQAKLCKHGLAGLCRYFSIDPTQFLTLGWGKRLFFSLERLGVRLLLAPCFFFYVFSFFLFPWWWEIADPSIRARAEKEARVFV